MNKPALAKLVTLIIILVTAGNAREWCFAGAPQSRIESIEVDDSNITIHGVTISSRANPMYLAELAPHQTSSDTPHGKVIRQIPLDTTGEFSVKIPRWTATEDRILSRFFLTNHNVQPLEVSSNLMWATDVTGAASYPQLRPIEAKSIKGLGGIHPDPRLFSDLTDLGVGHITVNITLNSLLRLDQNDRTQHRYGSKVFNFNTDYVQQLDRLLEFAHQNQIVVSAIILIPRTDRTSELGRVLVHPDATAGHYTLANVTSAEGVRSYSACLRFLAERYGPNDAPHGRISHWIIHNEVDAAWVWTNAGEKTDVEFMEQYARSLRIAYYSVRSFDPHAKVFITLTHHWNEPHQPNPKRFYKSRKLLELLQKHTAEQGDFEWGVAYHPYPQNLFNPRTWQDQKSKNDFDSPQITFKNLEVLDRWMKQKEYLYEGEKTRAIMLSEQGFHTPDESVEAQDLQAAALAYAWQKIKNLDSIKAFHYHRWIDHEREGGLKLGLWTVEPGSITWPKDKKRSWNVFRALGTETERNQIEFALPILGINDWNEIESPSP
jgi:hypothetical protein